MDIKYTCGLFALILIHEHRSQLSYCLCTQYLSSCLCFIKASFVNVPSELKEFKFNNIEVNTYTVVYIAPFYFYNMDHCMEI